MARKVHCLITVAAVALVVLGSPGRSAAEPIPITAGALQMEAIGGTLTLIGGDRFTFMGGVSVTGGVFGPRNSCLPCAPGVPISLAALWLGNDLRGTATLDGVTYTGVGGLAADRATGIVEFSGSAVAPPLEGLTATVVAPFLFEGQFFFPGSSGAPGFSEFLIGGGTATVGLFRSVETIPWFYRSALYEFEEVDPIPEPGTMLLAGTALAGAALRRRRQGRQRDG